MSNFARKISDITELQKMIQNDAAISKVYTELISKGKALLAFRNNEATIYYNGNRLFSLQSKNNFVPTVYNQYLPITRSHLKNSANIAKEMYSEEQWKKETKISNLNFSEYMTEILENIEKDSSPESIQASRFYRFSPLNSTERHEIVLLDIEAEFAAKGEKAERIDLVFYHTTRNELMFVEVKRLSDSRIKVKKTASGNNTPMVVNQLNGYKNKLVSEKADVISEYNNVIDYYNTFATNANKIPSIPENANILLGLLLVEFKSSDKKAVSDIKALIKKNDHKVYSIGNTVNATKDNTLAAIYKSFK